MSLVAFRVSNDQAIKFIEAVQIMRPEEIDGLNDNKIRSQVLSEMIDLYVKEAEDRIGHPLHYVDTIGTSRVIGDARNYLMWLDLEKIDRLMSDITDEASAMNSNIETIKSVTGDDKSRLTKALEHFSVLKLRIKKMNQLLGRDV